MSNEMKGGTEGTNAASDETTDAHAGTNPAFDETNGSTNLNEIGTSGVVDLTKKRATKKTVVVKPRRLGAGDIRKVRDIKTEEVFVKEWDGLVTIKALSAKERDNFESSVLQKVGRKGEREFTNKNIRAKLVVRCLINPDFSLMYGEQDAEWLGDKNASAINHLYTRCALLSGITEADENELEKNSLNGDGADSSSQ
jgi:hypothetical protein